MPGWGNLLFFDTEERRLPLRLPLPGLIFPAWDWETDETKILARIPKLGSQWRIIFDFKPTWLPSDASDTDYYEVLNALIRLKDSRPLVFPVFTFRGIRLIYRDDQERTKDTYDSPLPKPAPLCNTALNVSKSSSCFGTRIRTYQPSDWPANKVVL